MQGHIRRRSPHSYEYIVDVGSASAQRCQRCGKRFWVERQPKERCPSCGGGLIETEERRRETKAGYPTRKECQAAMAKVLVAVEEKTYVVSTTITVREFLQKEWLPSIRSTIRPTTYRSYVQHVECHIVPHIGNVKLERLGGATINSLYAKLAQSGKKNGRSGLSALSIRHVHAVLHRALKDAVRWGRLSRNPIESADPPRVNGSGHEMRTWTAEQLAAFLAATRDDRLHALWHLLALTGLRRGEALALTWDEVDLEGGSLSVRRALIPNGREVVVCEPKTARGRRVVALDPGTVEVLKGQAARQLVEQATAESWTDMGLIFTRGDGEALHPEVVSRFFRQAVKKAALPTIRLHDLRHTHATLALRAGIHPKVVSERLGHATVSVTLDTYSHAIPAMQEEAAVRIAGLVRTEGQW
jgi:integrase/ribosomal protein L37E